MTDYQQLQHWVDSIMSIPKPQRWERSLMDITGVTHHENMWSEIYKFFFIENEQHLMGDLFIRSLEELIGLGHFLIDFTVEREFVVNDDKRIDILLYNKDSRKAIIIENKVYHSLNNDLNLYQRSVRKMLGGKADVKTIVLGMHHYNLALYKQASEIETSNKFSITHKELLDKVFDNLSAYIKGARTEYIFLLKEYYKNICNMINKLDLSVLDFYSHNENAQRIAEIYRVYKHIEDFVSGIMECNEDSQLKRNLESMDMKCKTERGFVKYYFPNTNSQVMLTVFFRDKIFSVNSAPHIHMVLEVQGKFKKRLDEHENDIVPIISHYANEGIKLAEKTDKKNSTWRHLAAQTIHFSNLKEELPRLGEVVGEYINTSSSIIRLANEIIKIIG